MESVGRELAGLLICIKGLDNPKLARPAHMVCARLVRYDPAKSLARVPLHSALVCWHSRYSRFITVVPDQYRPFGRDERHNENCADAAAEDGKGHAECLRRSPRLHFAKLGTAHEEDLVYARHTAAQ